MAEYKDILGNKRVVADETVTISLERYNQLIIKEALTDTIGKCGKPQNIATFIIKGNCVDDLFHILHNNGYDVQMSPIPFEDTFRLDVTLKESEDK